MEEFSLLLEEYVVKSGSLLIAGDFNFHIDDTSDVSTKNFINLFEAFNLRIHATQATHRAGHILDLIITRIYNESFISNVDVHDSMISDHFTLICLGLQFVLLHHGTPMKSRLKRGEEESWKGNGGKVDSRRIV